MKYLEAAHFITHKHEIARSFATIGEAQSLVEDLNLGKPETMRPFRVETCKEHAFHVRRGGNVFVKQEKFCTTPGVEL